MNPLWWLFTIPALALVAGVGITAFMTVGLAVVSDGDFEIPCTDAPDDGETDE